MPDDIQMLTVTDVELFNQLVDIAKQQHDGHLTIMRFTTNWRVGFGTPMEAYPDIAHMVAGATFAEAAQAAIDDPRDFSDRPSDAKSQAEQDAEFDEFLKTIDVDDEDVSQ